MLDNLFCIRDVSYGGLFFVFRMNFHLGSTVVVIALPHFEQVVNLHKQKNILFGRNGSVKVDMLHQSRQ
jgi:hypothetical protein